MHAQHRCINIHLLTICNQFTDCDVLAGDVVDNFHEEICERSLGQQLEVILTLFKCVTTSSDPDQCLKMVKNAVGDL